MQLLNYCHVLLSLNKVALRLPFTFVKAHANGCNIVDLAKMLRPFALNHNIVGTCCV